MTADILTPGHIKAIETLRNDDFVVVGLLTDHALHGYKKAVMPFKDRKYIMEVVAEGIGNVIVVPQDTRDPTHNLKFYNCTAMASGDGWDEGELNAFKKTGVKKIDLKLKGEKTKRFSSSSVKERIWRQKP